MSTELLAAGCRNLLRQDLPDEPREAAGWLPPLREWRRRWPTEDKLPAWGPGSKVELGMLDDIIAELERIAADA